MTKEQAALLDTLAHPVRFQEPEQEVIQPEAWYMSLFGIASIWIASIGFTLTIAIALGS